MAQILTKKQLSESEIDNLVTQELVGHIGTFSREIYAKGIVSLLAQKKRLEISHREVIDSIKRLLHSNVLEIRLSNALRNSMDVIEDSKLWVVCNVELAQKPQKEA